jgi:Kef-type K+ transport system membrane component KefB
MGVCRLDGDSQAPWMGSCGPWNGRFETSKYAAEQLRIFLQRFNVMQSAGEVKVCDYGILFIKNSKRIRHFSPARESIPWAKETAVDHLAILTALAVILLGSLLGGRAASLCRVPRVTGYLLAGLLIGPSFARLTGLPLLLPPVALKDLRLISDVALALIMMNIGGQFRVENLRRWRHRIALFSLGEIGITFLAVAVAVLVVNGAFLHRTVAGLSLFQTSVTFAILLGAIAVATAPAATLMVIREYEAEGPVTSSVLTLVGLNNLVSVVAFIVAAHLLIRPTEGLAPLALHLFGPLLLGGAVGLGLAILTQRLDQSSEHKILLLGGVATCSALARRWGLDPLLSNLILGVVLANSAPTWHRLVESLRQIDYPLYVAFFVLAGATLHLETLAHIGFLGLAYVVARGVGKGIGAFVGARAGRFNERMQTCVGFALLAQAGVAIGLAGSLARQWPEGGHMVETVVLGAVVVFELVGPLGVRFGLVRAGEVPILSLLRKRAPQGALAGLHTVVHHFRSSLGLPAGHRMKDPGDILVRHVMRQNVETIRNDTPFNELLRWIAHSRYDRFPVIDAEGRFVGMINYTEIRSLLFEPAMARLVIASDLVSPLRHALFPDQPLREALKTMQLHRDISFFPVVDSHDPEHLLGILSQNDVLATFRKPRAE